MLLSMIILLNNCTRGYSRKSPNNRVWEPVGNGSPSPIHLLHIGIDLLSRGRVSENDPKSLTECIISGEI